MKPKNCVFDVSFNITRWCKNMISWKFFLYSPTKTSFSSSIINPCACLMISVLSGRSNVSCRWFRALIEFIICLQKLLALFGKASFWNKFHTLAKENVASASPSKTYVLYTNTALHSFVNSSTYEWFSYWSFNQIALCKFLTICDQNHHHNPSKLAS